MEARAPAELELHLAMNRARLATYSDIRAEVCAFIEARTSQVATKKPNMGAPGGSDKMDLDLAPLGGQGRQGRQRQGQRRQGRHGPCLLELPDEGPLSQRLLVKRRR